MCRSPLHMSPRIPENIKLFFVQSAYKYMYIGAGELRDWQEEWHCGGTRLSPTWIKIPVFMV